ncbi:hypothetical protein, partial [Sinorhizobium fredii]|uniref:hypothetical protein n=3 Tax=Sinorhizobium TaxID=28105 RepID=UPI001AEBCCEA
LDFIKSESEPNLHAETHLNVAKELCDSHALDGREHRFKCVATALLSAADLWISVSAPSQRLQASGIPEKRLYLVQEVP